MGYSTVASSLVQSAKALVFINREFQNSSKKSQDFQLAEDSNPSWRSSVELY